MWSMLLYIILASLVVSAISLVAIITIIKGRQFTDLHLKKMIGFASGVLLAAVFLELLPEIFETTTLPAKNIFTYVLLSILGFFLLERLIHWHHCHGHNCPPDDRTHVAYINLIGDGFHNFIDGILIAAAFLVSPALGIATTIAIIAHEIPQEISDATILLYAGLSKAKVIGYNFLFALTALIGAVLTYFFAQSFQNLLPTIVAIAAGNFIYLALADLIPELHHETESRKVATHIFWLFFGVFVFWLITALVGN
jgi:zinc and cadmium transporter